MASSPREVFSDDWWGRARPIIELHGYFRTRAQLFQNLFLGRHSSYLQAADPEGQYLAPIPLDYSYTQLSGTAQPVSICGKGGQTNGGVPTGSCNDKTESTANVRLRIDPEIAISDNLRIETEIFALDNLVLGSTPNAYAMQPGSTGSAAGTSGTSPSGYVSAGFNRFAPLSFFTTTQGPPTAGVNSTTNSIEVERVWAEYNTPVGELRFGRMPGHWGLGMIENSGDGIDSDYQTTLDRIMFTSGLKSMDLYFGAAWDFVATGPTTNATPSAFSVYGGQPYNTCNLCNVNEWAAFVAHRTNPELQRLKLSRGDLVLNGGVYTTFRSQYLDVQTGQTPYTDDYMSNTATNGLEPRRAWALTPDLWVQLLWRKFRFEAEAAAIDGDLGSSTISTNTLSPVGIHQYGVATQTELRAVEDKLDLQFGFGWASGDAYAYNTAPVGANSGTQSALTPGPNGLQGEYPNPNNQIASISTFRFHPDYHVDLLFFRNILQQIEGAYYFRPSIDYDFLRHGNGEKLGGGAAVIWSRASEFVQTPGHHRDLGVELDAQLYYQSKDGSLNDDPSKVGGFFAMLQYGVFFPLAGLDYLPSEPSQGVSNTSLSAAQTVRLFLGVIF
jgi:uncharacterized protein (TIGR04551 family)